MFEGTMNAGLKTFIIDTYKAQVEKLKELQDPKTGLWHTVLTAPDSYVANRQVLQRLQRGFSRGSAAAYWMIPIFHAL